MTGVNAVRANFAGRHETGRAGSFYDGATRVVWLEGRAEYQLRAEEDFRAELRAAGLAPIHVERHPPRNRAPYNDAWIEMDCRRA